MREEYLQLLVNVCDESTSKSKSPLKLSLNGAPSRVEYDRESSEALRNSRVANPRVPHSNVARFAALEWGLYSLQNTIVIPTGAGANATAQWRACPELAPMG